MRIADSNYFHMLAMAALLVLISCAAQATELTVRDGWFRALPPSVPSGGYFTLRNDGKAMATLTDVESPACGAMMMHQTTPGGMDHVMALDVRAGEDMVFAPGGYHLMCMASTPLLKVGTSVPVTLFFKDGQKITAHFQVRSATGK